MVFQGMKVRCCCWLLLLQADSRFRNWVYSLVTLQYFDYTMMMVVLLSCIQVCSTIRAPAVLTTEPPNAMCVQQQHALEGAFPFLRESYLFHWIY